MNHLPPTYRDPLQRLLTAYAQNSCPVQAHQLSFELSGLIVEWRTQILWNPCQPTVKIFKRCSTKLLNI